MRVIILFIVCFILSLSDLKAEVLTLSGNRDISILDSEILDNALKSDALPEGWEELKFAKIKNHTKYEVVKDGGKTVLRAKASGSASGLVKKVKIDLKEFPLLSWKWKVGGVLKGGDASKKSGDDYPARIYITFEYAPEATPFWDRVKYKAAKLIYGDVPSSAINYIWANKLKKSSFTPNAYTDKVIMFAVESGDTLKGRWATETRNVYEDYKLAFGKEPPLVSTIALMTDTDNTGEVVEAYYGEISFLREKGVAPRQLNYPSR